MEIILDNTFGHFKITGGLTSDPTAVSTAFCRVAALCVEVAFFHTGGFKWRKCSIHWAATWFAVSFDQTPPDALEGRNKLIL